VNTTTPSNVNHWAMVTHSELGSVCITRANKPARNQFCLRANRHEDPGIPRVGILAIPAQARIDRAVVIKKVFAPHKNGDF
jgi:hypothetical protein